MFPLGVIEPLTSLVNNNIVVRVAEGVTEPANGVALVMLRLSGEKLVTEAVSVLVVLLRILPVIATVPARVRV
jgi:hypothetical protein